MAQCPHNALQSELPPARNGRSRIRPREWLRPASAAVSQQSGPSREGRRSNPGGSRTILHRSRLTLRTESGKLPSRLTSFERIFSRKQPTSPVSNVSSGALRVYLHLPCLVVLLVGARRT